jgi:hypothetical protein
LIPIKTIPIAQGDQFEIFPSDNLGLGGVSIALADSLGDPFSNPATTARLRASRFFSAPTVYSLSHDAGGGRSLPFVWLVRRTDWDGGLAFVLRRSIRVVHRARIMPCRPPCASGGPPAQIGPRAHGNAYAFGMIGRSWAARKLSIGASALWTGLHALDGVDLLYSGSIRVKQSGDALDLRIGALKQWETEGQGGGIRSLEAVVVHNRFAATHDVLFADQFWDPSLQQFVAQLRTDHNLDHTNTWGAQLKYQRPLASPGWSLGWLATVNLASHPKLPNYEITNVAVIPWDPGRSHAYEIGVGVSKVLGPSTFGMDLIYQPIRSYTWAEAMAPTATMIGDTIPVGGKTVENRFNFSNAVFRIGAGRDIDLPGAARALGLQLGLAVRSISYRLQQADRVQLEQRELHTGWYEWTPTWGLTLRFTELELRYRGRVTKGAGRPGSQFQVGVLRDAAFTSGDILAAPNGPLSLVDVNTSTHQISLSLPIH